MRLYHKNPNSDNRDLPKNCTKIQSEIYVSKLDFFLFSSIMDNTGRLAKGLVPEIGKGAAANGSSPDMDGMLDYSAAMERATWTPLALAWDREWVMPEPSPMMYRPG